MKKSDRMQNFNMLEKWGGRERGVILHTVLFIFFLGAKQLKVESGLRWVFYDSKKKKKVIINNTINSQKPQISPKHSGKMKVWHEKAGKNTTS